MYNTILGHGGNGEWRKENGEWTVRWDNYGAMTMGNVASQTFTDWEPSTGYSLQYNTIQYIQRVV